ncbi:hypothetical protein R84981_001385 [Carnimonas sp. R-84981]|uniref:OsmC family protein n=1 Tax=Carnimonas bestiolae TaxID=3402172 RepID=UPI003EDB9382
MSSHTINSSSSGAPWQVAIHSDNHQWQADVDTDSGGGDLAPNPESYLLGALGACTAMTIRMYAERKQWPLQSVDVSVSISQHDKHSVKLERHISLTGELDEQQRQRLLEIAEKCPVHRLLTGDVTIKSSLTAS